MVRARPVPFRAGPAALDLHLTLIFVTAADRGSRESLTSGWVVGFQARGVRRATVPGEAGYPRSSTRLACLLLSDPAPQPQLEPFGIGWIYPHAGASCDVTHRSAECSLPFSAPEISIRMLARPANPHQTGLAVSIVKVADGRGVDSVVFHDRIVAAARRASGRPSLMLGSVMAHELGHWLGRKHAPRGIMKTTFSDQEMPLTSQSLLVFQEQEQRELRAVANRLDHSLLPATNGAAREPPTRSHRGGTGEVRRRCRSGSL